jgi:hypothetical protein
MTLLLALLLITVAFAPLVMVLERAEACSTARIRRAPTLGQASAWPLRAANPFRAPPL